MDQYSNPLVGRYSSKEMSYTFSPLKKFSTWRKLWLSLAKAEKQLGLPITDDQIKELESHQNITDEGIKVAKEYEKKFRHDVMSHVHAYGEECPLAKPIIHMGATSCFVGDNTDVIQMKEGLELLRKKMLTVIYTLSKFAEQYKDQPTLGFTHLQPAQLTSVGKRATLWLQDYLFDFEELTHRLTTLNFRGVKGTTGTQASFLDLFDGDHDKVRDLDLLVAKAHGFEKSVPVSGQTYTRKYDYQVLSTLAGIAQSAHKMAVDIRLLASFKEMEEPFAKNQIGSSAMAYKRNPMRSERICSLSRFVMNLLPNTLDTASNQWMERTLDDSANRRLSIAQAFLGTDAVLKLVANVVDGLVVYPQVIRSRCLAELPFMATENILMECVKKGGDRQELHEIIRVHSQEAAKQVKLLGKPNDLLDRLRKDDNFAAIHDQLDSMVEPKAFIGRAPKQVDEFLSMFIKPLLQNNQSLFEKDIADLDL